MYSEMEEWLAIRRRVLVEGVSKREILRETGLHWQTLEKILEHSSPPGYRLQEPRERPKLGPFLPRIHQILKDDREMPRKQRHTAKRIFERLCTETFWEGMIRAFAFFGGVPRRITFDNEGILVAEVLGPHGRKVTRGFLELQSHYLFEEHFCRVYRANEKGVVEGTVRYARLNFFVPVPQVCDLEELNAAVRQRCAEDLQRTLRGKGMSKAELLEEDRAMFLPLPAAPFDSCRKTSTFASSLSLARFDRNDYSVPVRYAHHPVVVKGYVQRVELCHKEQLIATHGRWRIGTFPRTSPCCGDAWRPKGPARGRASPSASCACGRPTPCATWSVPWHAACGRGL